MGIEGGFMNNQYMQNQKWCKDCESLCFDCGSKFMLKVKHDGVALCLLCRIREWFDRLADRIESIY